MVINKMLMVIMPILLRDLKIQNYMLKSNLNVYILYFMNTEPLIL